jgi:hypothetical protein
LSLPLASSSISAFACLQSLVLRARLLLKGRVPLPWERIELHFLPSRFVLRALVLVAHVTA